MPANAGTEDRRPFPSSPSSISLAAFLFATICVVVVCVLGLASAGSATAAAPVAVTLSEFKITPATINAAAGDVDAERHQQRHDGPQPLGDPGRAEDAGHPRRARRSPLDLGKLAAGTYEVVCLIPGHADSGMKATLVVAAAGSGTAARGGRHGRHGHGGMDRRRHAERRRVRRHGQEDERGHGRRPGHLHRRANATQGVGNQKLAADDRGRRHQGLQPRGRRSSTGRSRRARSSRPGPTTAWCPGPWIRTEPNDKVKVVIKNSLPGLHRHPLPRHHHARSTTDGVAPLTQPAIEPGATYTYSWTEPEPSRARHVPRPRPRPGRRAERHVRGVPESATCRCPQGQTIDWETIPGDLKVTQELPDGAQRRRHDRPLAQRQGYPGHRADRRRPGRRRSRSTTTTRACRRTRCTCTTCPQLVDRQGRLPARPAVLRRHHPDRPRRALHACWSPRRPTTSACGPGTATSSATPRTTSGLYGMVTALIVNDPNKP